MISMVMPIFNEERLLPYHLEAVASHVDQIVLVNGGPIGPSTDGTSDIIERHKTASDIEVTHIQGQYEQNDREGVWDKKAQIMEGVGAANGDFLIITSCDTVYDDYEALVETIKSNIDGKVFYALVREFFLDTDHLRMPWQNGYPVCEVGYPVVQSRIFSPDGFYKASVVESSQYFFLPDMRKYHYGWVTPFNKQVEKHIRHVRAGHWGAMGEELLDSGEEATMAWAITHTLHYSKQVVFPYESDFSHPWHQLDFDYMEGFDAVLAKFKSQFGKSYYDVIAD